MRLAKEMGATERDLAPWLNELIYRPLVALDRYQDKGVIEYAEIPSDSRPRGRMIVKGIDYPSALRLDFTDESGIKEGSRWHSTRR